MRMKLRPETLAVARLDPHEPVPAWATAAAFWCIARSEEELSVVCPEDRVPVEHHPVEYGWRALVLAGPIPFALTGVLASVLSPLAGAGISIFAFSTFDTDYVLVRAAHLDASLAALRDAGHVIL